MIPDWETNRVSFSNLLPGRHPALWSRLAALLGGAGVEHRLIEGTRDLWARDFMPVQKAVDDFVPFRYRPTYIRESKDPVTPDEVRSWTPPGGVLRTCDINLDGSNVVAGSDKAMSRLSRGWRSGGG
jgi:agmatine deiminase